MRRATLAALSAVLLASAALPANASARIEGVSVTRSSMSAGTPATLVLSMKRATPLDLAPCDLLIDTGDGEKPLHVTFGPTDSQTKTVSYTFKKAGSFRVNVKGTGRSACEGERATEVLVTGSPGAAAPVAQAAARVGCPAGWSVVMQEGSKLTCRANPPPVPIKCEAGTKYFAENGQIGCR